MREEQGLGVLGGLHLRKVSVHQLSELEIISQFQVQMLLAYLMHSLVSSCRSAAGQVPGTQMQNC